MDAIPHSSLHVTLLTTSFPLTENDVSGVFIERLAYALSRHARVTVVTPDGPHTDDTKSHTAYNLITARYAPRSLQRIVHSPGGLPSAIDTRDPALIFLPLLILALFFKTYSAARRSDIVHGNWSGPSIIAAIAARLAGRPSVSTLRGDDITRVRSSIVFRSLLRLSLRLNNYTICVSAAMAESLQTLFPAQSSRVLFIPNGVSAHPTRPQPKFSTPVRLLSVGSCIPRKRHELILHALARNDLRTRFHLRIVGDGPQFEHLKKVARDLDLERSVSLSGALPPYEIPNCLLDTDIFVLVSESEGRPNALLEAMAAGLPIIASDIDGVHELLKDGAGFLVNPATPETLSRALDVLTSNPDYAQQLARAARSRIYNLGLTWNSCADRHLRIYRSLTK